MSRRIVLMTGLIVGITQGCGKPATTESTEVPETASGAEQKAPPMTPEELGGRLFDNWYAELGVEFVPDDPKTPELDGKGGPNGNGTLPSRDGTPMANPGHGFRLKNLFGWDLRGAEGIYGEGHLAKGHVLVPDLLKNVESRETWVERLTKGEDAIPAFGQVLSAAQIDAIVTFLVAVRDGTLPQPADVFALTTKEQGHYTLAAGADAARGHEIFAQTCAHCHGTDGAKFAIDDGKYSVGSQLRQKAYETWLKTLSGQPGTPMHGQIEATLTREQKAAVLRDLHAAACDRTRYPKGPGSEPDVADGDARCGAYLR